MLPIRKQLNATVDRELIKAFKLMSVEQNRPLFELVEEAMKSFLATEKEVEKECKQPSR